MGRLFKDFFKSAGIKVLISDPSTSLGSNLTNTQLSRQSDIVIISVPIDQTEKVIKEVLPSIRPSSAIMDFTSIKEQPVKAMLRGKCEVLGMHPMFGNTNPIPGQTIIFCPTKKSGHWSKWMTDFLQKNGAKIEKMTPTEHDKAMNIAQGLIHFAEITFADSIRRCKMPVKKLFNFTGKASELKVQLAARLIAQDAGLYGNIQISNPYALNSLREFRKSTEELFKIVAKKDIKGFKNYFEKNKKFYGKYLNEAYADSSFLIDKLMELKAKKQKTIRREKPGANHLAVLGPANTFSDIAAEKYLDAITENFPVTNFLNHQRHSGKSNKVSLKKYFAHDIDEIFNLVEKGTVAAGIVPIENKLHGSVRETLDGLFSENVQIVSEITIPIHHCLICLTHANKDDIKTIISHSQALSQCKKYLQKNFSKAELASAPSTGTTIEKLINCTDKSVAVIAPDIAAKNPKLKILANNIEDQHDNATTFAIIKKCHRGHFLNWQNLKSRPAITAPGPELLKSNSSHSTKTSIAFYFSADAPGSLFTVFQDFADAKINLTKIESRPTRKQFGDYIFYLDFAGHVSDSNIQKTLQKVSRKVAKLKILGSY